jgi:AcrR family transcriptional regulator
MVAETPLRSKEKKERRNSSATKERILQAGLEEFGFQGYRGARIATIVEKAGCNIRMLYHYFGAKRELYLACLDRVYFHIRQEEQKLDLLSLEPVEAICALVEFTFDHMRNNIDFVYIAGVENAHKGEFLKKLPPVSQAARYHIETIGEILREGEKVGVIREDIDAFQLYISILSLSYVHLSNRYTLSVSYGCDIGDERWLEERKDHVRALILSYVVK